jgi:hypothetical protein
VVLLVIKCIVWGTFKVERKSENPKTGTKPIKSKIIFIVT